MRSVFMALALLALTSCGGTPLRVEVATSPAPLEELPAYLSAPGLEAHVREVAAAMAEGWGGDSSALDGYLIRFEQHLITCGASDLADGCTRGSESVIDLLAWGSACVEATVLAHEVGHVVIGDSDHRDPRWREPHFWGRMRETAVRMAPAGCDLSLFDYFNEVHDD